MKLHVLLLLGDFGEILKETVKCQILLVVNEDFEGVLHELADGSDLLGESCREHHDLLLVRGALEDGLDVASHVFPS